MKINECHKLPMVVALNLKLGRSPVGSLMMTAMARGRLPPSLLSNQVMRTWSHAKGSRPMLISSRAQGVAAEHTWARPALRDPGPGHSARWDACWSGTEPAFLQALAHSTSTPRGPSCPQPCPPFLRSATPLATPTPRCQPLLEVELAASPAAPPRLLRIRSATADLPDHAQFLAQLPWRTQAAAEAIFARWQTHCGAVCVPPPCCLESSCTGRFTSPG